MLAEALVGHVFGQLLAEVRAAWMTTYGEYACCIVCMGFASKLEGYDVARDLRRKDVET
jgi:hypothetical protein